MMRGMDNDTLGVTIGLGLMVVGPIIALVVAAIIT